MIMDIKQAKFMEEFIRLTSDAFKKGWHERNGGNLTFRIKNEEIEAVSESLYEICLYRGHVAHRFRRQLCYALRRIHHCRTRCRYRYLCYRLGCMDSSV